MRYRQNQKNKLREHYRNHIYYRLCRQIHNVFQQYRPQIILSAEELFADAARTLDTLLTEQDLEAERCMNLWPDTMADYRDKDGILADAATTEAEVAMLFYAVMLGLQSVDHSHYRGKLQRVLHKSIHHMWNKQELRNCDEIEKALPSAVNTLTEGMCNWMEKYLYSTESLTDEISGVIRPKKAKPRNKQKDKERIYFTLPYNCKDESTRVNRINKVMLLMQEWEWIEEPQHADDFYYLFNGEPRNCNIKWIGRPLAILTELMKQLLNQPYMNKVKGLTPSSIVKNQFGKSRSSNSERLDEMNLRKIEEIVRILDFRKPLQSSSETINEEEEVSRNIALQAVYEKELYITKDIKHNY